MPSPPGMPSPPACMVFVIWIPIFHKVTPHVDIFQVEKFNLNSPKKSRGLISWKRSEAILAAYNYEFMSVNSSQGAWILLQKTGTVWEFSKTTPHYSTPVQFGLFSRS